MRSPKSAKKKNKKSQRYRERNGPKAARGRNEGIDCSFDLIMDINIKSETRPEPEGLYKKSVQKSQLLVESI